MEAFTDQHSLQLHSLGLPQPLVEVLFQKLSSESFDAGSAFQIFKTVNEDDQVVGQELKAVRRMTALEEVYLVDHAWSFRVQEMRAALHANPTLFQRVKQLVEARTTKFDLPQTEPDPPGVFDAKYSEFDDMQLTRLPDVPAYTELLSLSDNLFTSLEPLETWLPSLKALWVDGNPLTMDEEALFSLVEEAYPNIELLNRKLTRNAAHWAMHYVSNKQDLTKVTRVDLSGRGVVRVQPDILELMPNLVAVDLTDNEVTLEWVAYLAGFVKVLKIDQPELVWNRISQFQALKYLNDLDVEKGPPDEVDQVVEQMWKVLWNYRMATQDSYDESPVWYLLDELGSSVLHSDQPNFRLAPFVYYRTPNECISYSVLWPVRDVEEGETAYADFLRGVSEQFFRSFRLYPWFNIPMQPLKAARKLRRLPATSPVRTESIVLPPVDKQPLRVLTDFPFFAESLTDPRFVVVTEEEGTDILWCRRQMFEGTSTDVSAFAGLYINQFPAERCFTMKANLGHTIQRRATAAWLPLTFDLTSELPAFMGEYLNRQQTGQDNHWIIKPSNMARGIDCIVTNNLDFVVRQLDSGPKLAQKYVTEPLLLNGCKFDLRYIVLVCSFAPLSLFIHDKFFIRSANKPFNLNYATQEDYQTHFTVMNYAEFKLQRIEYDQFIRDFEAEHGEWTSTQALINSAVKELFSTAAAEHPEMQHSHSRAIYGIDVMLDKDKKPYILEVNFSPDCKRAIEYYPSYTNELFNALFFSEFTNITML